MLYLNSEDVLKLTNFEEMVKQIEKAIKIYESKEFVMPDRINANYKDETYLYMPCYSETIKGTKILTLYPKNPKKGLPVIQGVMLLNDNDTGKIKCLIDGAVLTAVRTGAVGATGVKYTTKEDCISLGIVGTGVQGFYQALYTSKIRNIKNIYVSDLSKERRLEFIKKLSEKIENINIHEAKDTKELVANSEIIITTTNSNKPVLPDDEKLLKGKHFIGIGSYKPFMREYPRSLYKLLDKVYIDVDFAKEESGDLCIPLESGWIKEEQIETLGKTISTGKLIKSETTFYKSVGMALFDIITAEYLYSKAIKNEIGQRIIE